MAKNHEEESPEKREHYSDKGSHGERSKFWKRLRKLTGDPNPHKGQKHDPRRITESPEE